MPELNVPSAPVIDADHQVVTGVEFVQAGRQLLGHGGVDGVARLGPVDGEHRDTIVKLEQDLVGHRALPSVGDSRQAICSGEAAESDGAWRGWRGLA